jgi:hypothetical protein
MAQVRGLFTFSGVLHAVRGDTLYSIDSAGATTTLGTLFSAAGPVDMAQNLTQLVIADGDFLYVWDGATLSTAVNYTPGRRIAFIDQRIVFIHGDSQRFGWTALGDAKTIAALDFASAESNPDKLVAVVASARELLLLGESSAEVWYSVGGTEVFRRSDSEILDDGCAAAFSALRCGDTPVWLSSDANGHARVLAGRAQRVSTRAIEERFEGRDVSAARAWTYSDGPHRFYCLNIPGVDTTLVYDLAFAQWHERAELINGNYKQWRPRCHAFAYGQHYLGAADGSVYRMDPTAHTIAGSVLCRDRIMPVISQPSRRRLRFPGAELVGEKGTGADVALRWSDDNGATWSGWRQASTGATGKHAQTIRWNRLGSAFDRVLHMRMTDDAPLNPISMHVEIA